MGSVGKKNERMLVTAAPRHNRILYDFLRVFTIRGWGLPKISCEFFQRGGLVENTSCDASWTHENHKGSYRLQP